MSDREITICRDRADLAKKAADYFVVLANERAAETGRFTVALSGGSTPKVLYSLLATLMEKFLARRLRRDSYNSANRISETSVFEGHTRCFCHSISSAD